MTWPKKNPAAARMKRIYARQSKPAFGAKYQPAIRATREEAPKISWAFAMFDNKLGRVMHLLSTHELAAALFARYIPNCWDVHEQAMLWTEPHTHPLFDYPGVDATTLTPVEGTLLAAHRLGHLAFHPKIRVPSRDDIEGQVAYPLIGDLLLFLSDEQGRYCVNWPIKRAAEDFWRPTPFAGQKNMPRAIRRAIARTEIEMAYYESAKIRSHLVFFQPRFRRVVANLRLLHGFEVRRVQLPDEHRYEMVRRFNAAMANGGSATDQYLSLGARFACPWTTCQTVFFQAIWRRELRVDLYQPILTEYPIEPERQDFLDDIKDWFRR